MHFTRRHLFGWNKSDKCYFVFVSFLPPRIQPKHFSHPPSALVLETLFFFSRFRPLSGVSSRFVFRPSSTVSRIGLMESRLRRRCRGCAPPPWLATPSPRDGRLGRSAVWEFSTRHTIPTKHSTLSATRLKTPD